jgi:hypothetical protein
MFLNIGSRLLEFLMCGLGLLNIGFKIVPRLLDRRMSKHESLELKRLIAFW